MIRQATEPGMEYDPPGPNFRILSDMLEPNGIPSLATPEGQAWFEPYLDQADVFLFDHLSALFGGGEENAAESWDTTQEWLKKLRKLGKTSLFAHHDNKTREQRGTSKREDILNISIHLLRYIISIESYKSVLHERRPAPSVGQFPRSLGRASLRGLAA